MLTFVTYTSYHLSRKPFSVVKVQYLHHFTHNTAILFWSWYRHSCSERRVINCLIAGSVVSIVCKQYNNWGRVATIWLVHQCILQIQLHFSICCFFRWWQRKDSAWYSGLLLALFLCSGHVFQVTLNYIWVSCLSTWRGLLPLFSGAIADRVNLRFFLTLGMLGDLYLTGN